MIKYGKRFKMKIRRVIVLLIICLVVTGCCVEEQGVVSLVENNKGEVLTEEGEEIENAPAQSNMDESEENETVTPSATPMSAPKPFRQVYYEEGKYLGYFELVMDGDRYRSFEVHYADEKKEKEEGYRFDDFRYEKDKNGNDLYQWNIDLEESDFYSWSDGQRLIYEYDDDGNVKKVKSIPIIISNGKYEENIDAESVLTYKYKNGIKTDSYVKCGSSIEHHKYKDGICVFYEKKSKYDPFKKYYDRSERLIKAVYPYDGKKYIYKYGLKDSNGRDYNICKFYEKKDKYNIKTGKSYKQTELVSIVYNYTDENGCVIESKGKDSEGLILSCTEMDKKIIEEINGEQLVSLKRRYSYCDYHGINQKLFSNENRELYDSSGKLKEKIYFENEFSFVDLHMGLMNKQGLMKEKYRIKYYYDESEARDPSIYQDYEIEDESVPEYILKKEKY